MTTNTVPTLTAAEKRKAARERNKARQAAAKAHRDEMFENMTKEEMSDMTDRLEAIKDSYSQRMEEAEDEILSDLHSEFEEVLADYSYDTIKSYVEDLSNGKTGFPGYLDLNHWVDEHKDETSFGLENTKLTAEEAAEFNRLLAAELNTTPKAVTATEKQ